MKNNDNTFEHTMEDELWELRETLKYLTEKIKTQEEEIKELSKEIS